MSKAKDKVIKNVIGYTRVSTFDQSQGNFTSLDNQEKAIRSYAELYNWKVLKIYTDTASGAAVQNRKGFLQMVEDIKNNKDLIDALIVYKIDRLTRSQQDFYNFDKLLQEHNIDFVSTTQKIDTSGSMGKFFRDILVIFSAFEREMTAERTHDKMVSMAEKGRWLGGYVPYGYRINNKKLVVNKEEAEFVKIVFQKYRELASTAKVAHFMNNEDYRTKERGKSKGGLKFNKILIWNILNNIQVTGQINYANKIYKGEHEAIISIELFNEIQELLTISKENKKMTYLPKADFYLLNIAKCGCCKNEVRTHNEHYALTTSKSIKKKSDGTRTPYYYYRCINSEKRGASECSFGQIQKDLLEDFVFSKLIELAKKPELLEKILLKADKENKIQVIELEEKLNKLQNELNDTNKIIKSTMKNFADFVKEGDDKNNPFIIELKKMQTERISIQSQIDELNFNIEAKKQNLVNKQALIKAYNHFDKILKDGNKEDIIDFVKLIINEVVVNIDKKTKRGQIIIKPHGLTEDITEVFISEKAEKTDKTKGSKKENRELVNLSDISSRFRKRWLRWRDSNPRPSG